MKSEIRHRGDMRVTLGNTRAPSIRDFEPASLVRGKLTKPVVRKSSANNTDLNFWCLSRQPLPVVLLGNGEMVATLVFEISACKGRVRSSRTSSANY